MPDDADDATAAAGDILEMGFDHMIVRCRHIR